MGLVEWWKRIVGERDRASVPLAPPPPTPEAWQDRVRRLQLSPEERVPVSSLASAPVAGRPTSIEVLRRILVSSGLSWARPEDVDYVIKSFKARKLAREMWKAPEYLAMLNEAGRSDHKEAWHATVRPCHHALACERDLDQARKAGIDTVKLRASNMAAGPCPKAAALDGAKIAIGRAELLPIEECTHPDQCACLYQSWIGLMDDLGD